MPWDLPLRIKREVADNLAAADWARYPDFHADALRQDLGLLHGHPWEGVLVGNGSNELLSVALTALVGTGARSWGPSRASGSTSLSSSRPAACPVSFRRAPDLRLPADEIEAEIERNPRRPLLLCTPNNPTGDALPPERIACLLERLEAPLLLDNAYGEFCRWDYRPLLAEYPHLVLFRTFSKAWSLAGLRLGYLLADPRLVAELIKVKLPYNLGHAAVAAGRAVLAERQEEERRVRLIIARRAQWARMLVEEGFEVLPLGGEFPAHPLHAGGAGGGGAGRSRGARDSGARRRRVCRGSPGACGCRWGRGRRCGIRIWRWRRSGRGWRASSRRPASSSASRPRRDPRESGRASHPDDRDRR